MNRMRPILLSIVWTAVALTFLIVVVYENHWLLEGCWADRHVWQFGWQIVMEFLTLAAIPLSFFLFRFKRVHRRLVERREKALLAWGSLRLLLLCVPMILNAVLYYQFMAVAFGYMGIILLLSLFFVYPSKARCEMELAELDKTDDGQEKDIQDEAPDGVDRGSSDI